LERYDEAEDRCRAAIAAAGDSAARRHALAGVLFEQGRVEESIVELNASLTLTADAPAVHSDLLRAMNYHDGFDPQTVYEAHTEWGRRYAEPLSRGAAAHANDRDPARRLRVGYVSPYFRKHAVTFFFESVVQHHDRSAFDLVLYADVPRPDDYSERLRSYGAQWRSTVGLSDAALAQMVRNDAIDVLVDLSGHTPGNRLLAFARKPAPIQVTWNGYPNTTGTIEMDYRVTDARCDPPGATERFHTEKLVRLPEIYMSWQAPAGTPAPGPLPASSAAGVTFASFNACYKVTPTIVRLWSRILDELPASRLVLFTVPRGRAEERIRRLFAAEGITGSRIETRPRVSHEAFLEAHREVDIALDSFPYHGTTTTCFSLWMGVPVVSLVGPTHVSRVGLTLLSSAGVPDLAAFNADDYVAAAVRLARNMPELVALRVGLRERMLRSPLMNGAACAKALEDAYRGM
jgi:predicted O-linked N-acetylglucosamine transferase (SPINDLY family)